MKGIKKFKNSKGFTLIELTLTLSMFSILGLFLFSSGLNINKTRNSLQFDSDAISSLIRSMQNKTASFVSSDINNVGYGVFFDLNNKNKVESFYKTTATDFNASEILNTRKPESNIILNSGNYVNRICLNGTNCSATSRLAIYFVKPKPYAKFAIYNGVSYSTTTTIGGVVVPISKVCVEIASPKKANRTTTRRQEFRRIEVYSVGQISFANKACQ